MSACLNKATLYRENLVLFNGDFDKAISGGEFMSVREQVYKYLADSL